MVLHIGILEDQPEQLRLLQQTVEKTAGDMGTAVSIQCYAAGEEIDGRAAAWADLFFLDIETRGENGMEAARRIRALNDWKPIVFTTGHTSYLFEGYKVQAFRYLMKPVSEADCRECMERAACLMRSRVQAQLLMQQKGMQIAVPYDDILYIEAKKHYCHLYTGGQEVKLRRGFGEILEELPETRFVQCHRSFLVNISKIRMLERQSLVLEGGLTIPVSRGFYDAAAAALIGR